MDLESLYKSAIHDDGRAEQALFEALAVRFGLIAHHRIWNDDGAKEVVQEALTVVAREYREIEIHTSFAAWAQRVLDNRILAYHKAVQVETRRSAPDTIDPADWPDRGNDPDLKIRLCECLVKVGKANRRYARILNLHYQGYGTDEICRRLGISEGNCYVVLARARKMLETCLEEGTV